MIKKIHQEIIDFLNTNKDQVVEDILQEVINLASKKTKSAGTKNNNTIIYYLNEDNEKIVLAKKCYGYDKYLLIEHFNFKNKELNTYNQMSKEANTRWTRANKDLKTKKEDLHNDFIANTITKDEYINQFQELQNTTAKSLMSQDTELETFDTYEDICDYLTNQGYTVLSQ